nr:hypothetical protein [Thioflavicoccus mobilis]
MWDAHKTRKPRSLFGLFGLFLLRAAERALFWLSFQEPPRTTRRHVIGRPHRLDGRRIDYGP